MKRLYYDDFSVRQYLINNWHCREFNDNDDFNDKFDISCYYQCGNLDNSRIYHEFSNIDINCLGNIIRVSM